MDDERLFRVLTNRATRAEIADVEAWLAESPDHARRYEDLAALHARARTWYDSSTPPAPPSARALIARANGSAPQTLRGGASVGVWRFALAIAATIVVVVSGVQVRRLVASHAAPVPALAAREFVVADTGTTAFVLDDGTHVRLGPNSHLRVEPRAGSRDVFLDGRAEFTVAHMADRPFRVHTSIGDATDIGTRFVVRVDRGAMRVAVFEGRVAIASSRGGLTALQLGAGDIASILADGGPTVVRGGNVRTMDQWLRAGLILDGSTLNDVGREFQRRDHYRVVVRDTVFGQHTINAWFKETPTPHDAMTAICRAVGAQCQLTDSLAVISGPRP